MSAYKKTDIDVAIVDWLQKNSNKENTFCIDEIIKQIYEVEDREFNELIDKKYNNNNCKQKRSEKRKDRRNQNRKTVAKHLEKLISNGIIRSIERKKCEVIEGGGEEGIDFDTENLGENWFREWQFFYNQPIGLIELKALCECALQLNNVLIDEKLKLVDSLAVCAGENLAESFKKNLQISNPSYAAALQLYEDNGIKPVNNYTFAGTRWTKGHLTYDNVDVLSNLDQIYNCFLSKGRKHPKMRFKLYNFDESGNREFIRGSGVYECFPLYIFSSEGRFWLVNIMHTTNTACGYYEHYNFSPLDLMDDWMRLNGGGTTALEFTFLSQEKRKEVLEFMENFALYAKLEINGQSYVLVHGGLGNFEKRKTAGCIHHWMNWCGRERIIVFLIIRIK